MATWTGSIGVLFLAVGREGSRCWEMVSWWGRTVVIARCQGVCGPQVTAAGDGQFEAVNVKTLLVSVGQKPHKVVFLKTRMLLLLVIRLAGYKDT